MNYSQFLFSVLLCQELSSFVGSEDNWSLSCPFYQNMEPELSFLSEYADNTLQAERDL